LRQRRPHYPKKRGPGLIAAKGDRHDDICPHALRRVGVADGKENVLTCLDPPWIDAPKPTDSFADDRSHGETGVRIDADMVRDRAQDRLLSPATSSKSRMTFASSIRSDVQSMPTS
jgi:hypothetical protein